MKTQSTLTQEDFDALLGWLSENREESGRQYELIRNGLIRFFRFRGCVDPPLLADETINRVTKKISTLDFSKDVKTITYFYGFASNVYLEYLREIKKLEVPLDSEVLSSSLSFKAEKETTNVESECLEKCLLKLPFEESDLVIQYYGKDKSEKFEMRRKLAQTMNLKMPALHTKVFRIRNLLRGCIEKCVERNSL